jgi:hypothetical protein
MEIAEYTLFYHVGPENKESFRLIKEEVTFYISYRPLKQKEIC